MPLCWSIRRALDAYAHGQLEGLRAQQVARHLRACSACQSEFRRQQRLTFLLRSLHGPSRSPEYWPRALLQLRKQLNQRPRYPLRSILLGYLRDSAANPAQALLPLTFIGIALFTTLTFLGLQGEAMLFFTSYLLPIVLE